MVFVWILTLQVKAQGAFARKKPFWGSKYAKRMKSRMPKISRWFASAEFAYGKTLQKPFVGIFPNPFPSIEWNVGTDPIQTDIRVFIKTDGPESSKMNSQVSTPPPKPQKIRASVCAPWPSTRLRKPTHPLFRITSIAIDVVTSGRFFATEISKSGSSLPCFSDSEVKKNCNFGHRWFESPPFR